MADLTVLAQIAFGGLLLGALYALLASGLSLIFGVMRVINIAHADLMIVGSYVTFWMYALGGINPVLSLPVSFLVLFGLGMVLQRFLLSRVVNSPELTSLLLTFGISILVQNLQLQFFSADYRSVPWLTGSLFIGDFARFQSRMLAAMLAILITGGTYVFLQRSSWGKAIRATSQQPDVAMVCGIDVGRVRMLTFGLGAGLAGTAGTLLVTMYAISPDTGHLFTLKGFACIVLGGMGNFMGAFLGGIILGVGEAFGGFFISPQLAEAISYVVLLLVLLVRPGGLLGALR